MARTGLLKVLSQQKHALDTQPHYRSSQAPDYLQAPVCGVVDAAEGKFRVGERTFQLNGGMACGVKVSKANLYVDGLQVINGEVPAYTGEQAAELARASQAYTTTWAQTAAQDRIAAVQKIAAELRTHVDAIAQAVARDSNKTLKNAKAEIVRTAQFLEDLCKEYAEFSKSKIVERDGQFFVQWPQTVGFYEVFGATNYPINENFLIAVQTLLTGNTTCLKVPRTGETSTLLCYEITQRVLIAQFGDEAWKAASVVFGEGREVIAPMAEVEPDAYVYIGGRKPHDENIKPNVGAAVDSE